MTQQFLYSQFKETDFFQFFNLNEVGRERVAGNERISLKPGGFQEHIDIILDISENLISEARLYLDRIWIGDENSINSFAKDICKSFLAALIPDALNQEFKISLVQGIWNMRGRKDRVICLDKVILNWEDSNPQVKQFLEVIRGTKVSASIELGILRIIMENLREKETGKERLYIKLIWK
ncbi:MAG: hypothetical protein EU544_04920 [Promethearchaeota archaeon]|nr:MAG: hypothetical protein EU544_04920 [Candidatus Lokiarchaeota archaeon]